MNKIPPIIHYCWFGGKEKPELAKKCIDSWKKYCPEYQIKEWNENNFNIDCCQFVKDAYKEKKWAFIADYVRLYAMVNEGGIYMDTDVEVCKPLDEFLDEQAFSGFQTEDSIPTGIMACEKGYHVFKKLLNDYNTRSFYNEDGSLNLTPNVVYITDEYRKYGLELNNRKQTVEGFTLYPVDYFCAKSWETGIVTRTENTYTIHHFAGSWFSDKNKQMRKVKHFCYTHFGKAARPIFLIYKYILHPRNLLSVANRGKNNE